jgi:hypothetical protein
MRTVLPAKSEVFSGREIVSSWLRRFMAKQPKVNKKKELG